MTDACVTFMLDCLKTLYVSHIDVLEDVKEKVEQLFRDLTISKCLINDYTKKSSMSSIESEFVKQVRDLVYRSEDVIDKYVHEASMDTMIPFSKERRLKILKSEIESIKREAKQLYEILYNFESMPVGEGRGGSKHIEKALILEEGEDSMVGFEDEKMKVITLLKEGSNELEVVSVVGMPGLGKTTLAKMVFCDSDFSKAFEFRAWVHVSESYTRREILLTILENFMEVTQEMYNMTDTNLGKKLYQCLMNGKYFIVMDNVWSVEVWDNLVSIFPRNVKHSRILLITRVSNVAKHANPKREPQRLRLLNSEESWILLRMKALGSLCPKHLERHGKSIANKCKGLPLALAIIGGILSEKGTQGYWWQKVDNFVDTYLFLDPQRGMDKVIRQSYSCLPYSLKACFLYFGMFPKGFEISTDELFYLWIAEGFIEQKEGMNLEDIAEEYLEDLINRNLIIVEKRRSNGTVKTCKIHDMLQEFCKKLAEDENFFLEIKCNDEDTFEAFSSTMTDVRRLCISSEIFNFMCLKLLGSHVRSVLFLSPTKMVMEPGHFASVIRAFDLLRVLRVRPISFRSFPGDMDKMIHLKYLVLCGSFKIIPSAISNLWKMQTLIIETSEPILHIKADIRQMSELRHLITNVPTSLPDEVTKPEECYCLTSLQTFAIVTSESCTIELIDSIPNIKKFSICGRLALLVLGKGGFDCLQKLRYLTNLKLMNEVLAPPLCLPEHLQFPPMLNKLTLSNTQLDWEQMSILGRSENLEMLKLKEYAFKGDLWKMKQECFSVLKVLHIVKTDLVQWEASAHHFPQLTCLYLKQCTSLEEVPEGFADIASLDIMELYHTHVKAEDCARKIESQKQKTTHGSGFKLVISSLEQVQSSIASSTTTPA
ncbi:late blight resistance homolog R1B-17 [Olea europaea subsp. europaea]|uniref:Late blight resistance homolog R1B-17 n=1 Tax=Olea europaea subsp. europaea TaxID=158383 RepID=A0A8S0PIY5_OLEEU|nr:late blight resistance homolog R1B-17 [Olea europaea subsp. europaea]